MSMMLQPDPDPQNRTLVEREGVNAGSDASTVEDGRDRRPVDASATVAGGGREPQRPDERADSALAPPTDAVESGQDNGSMS